MSKYFTENWTPKDLQIPDWAKEFITYTYSTGSHHTAFVYANNLIVFLRWYHWTYDLGHSPVEDVSTEEFQCLSVIAVPSSAVLKLKQKDIRDFVSFCREKLHHKESSILVRLTPVRSLLDYYITHELDGVRLRSNVARAEHLITNANVTAEAAENDVAYLTPAQIAVLLGSVTGKDAARDQCILKFLLSTGVTVSELASLNVYDICKTANHSFTVGGKTGRTLFMSADLYWAYTEWLHERELLIQKIENEEKYRPDHNALFLNTHQGYRLTVRRMQQIVDKHIEAAELGVEASPQILRNSFVMMLLNAGTPIDQVQAILGHKSRRITEQYLQQLQKSDISTADVMTSFTIPALRKEE